jgi:toxin ParE1/3/4
MRSRTSKISTTISLPPVRRKTPSTSHRLLEVTENLTTFPERGSQQKELRLLGFKEYRQAFFNSYRTIYRVIGEQVVVYVIADGRHDMQTLLSRRLFGR